MKAIVKVGKNEINVEVLEEDANGFTVKSESTGRTFHVKSLVRRIEEAPAPAEQTAGAEAVKEFHEPTPAPAKKMSLMNAAVEVLKTTGKELNTREIVKEAIDRGLWIPTACKTPEQTLYGSIFRELAVKENPRIVKGEAKGKFKFAG